MTLSLISSAWGKEPPFVIGELYGQLGNQCFIIAATLSHAWDHEAIPLFPDLKNKIRDNTSLNYKKVFWRLTQPETETNPSYRYIEPHFHYATIPYYENMTLGGYYQSEKYFSKYKQRICELFAPSKEIKAYLEDHYQELLDNPFTVSVHYRGYKKNDAYCCSDYHSLTKEYYKKAFAHFPKETLFVVFSDDLTWCKQNLSTLAPNIRFIENEPHYLDFYLMSFCKHHIISNSTFSWWGAYLGANPTKTIIAPKQWFSAHSKHNIKDLYPESWLLID